MSKSVTLAGQILHGSDRFGLWRIHSLEGWKETPSEKSNTEARALADGDYDAEVFYASRLVTVNGRLSAINSESAFMASERLSSLLRAPSLFSVDQFGMMRWGTARRGRIAPGAIRGRHLPFQLELRFNDPYKYGAKVAFSGAVGTAFDVHQRGTTPAWPLITVTGSMPGGYEVMIGGQLIEVTRALTTGNPHTIDTRTGILRVNGAVVVGGLGIAELFRIQPGLPQSVYSVPKTTGTGTVKLDITDTYT